jgi:hypothetical protein
LELDIKIQQLVKKFEGLGEKLSFATSQNDQSSISDQIRSEYEKCKPVKKNFLCHFDSFFHRN